MSGWKPCRTRRSKSRPTRSSRSPSTTICGSDLHLYEVLGAFMHPGDILGHEPMGIVREGGLERRTSLSVGRAGGHPVPDLVRSLLHVRSGICTRNARPPRFATRAWGRRCSAIPSSTARSPAARPNTFGCPKPTSPTSRCRDGPPDSRFVYLSDVLPTAWQAVAYADDSRGRLGDRCSGWGRSVTWRPASPTISAIA